MSRPPLRSTRTYTLFPYTTLFRSELSPEPATALAERRWRAQHLPFHARQSRRPAATLILHRLKGRGRDSTTATGRKRKEREWYQTVRRSEEHTSELQSLMRTSYAAFCLKRKQPTEYKLKRHT